MNIGRWHPRFVPLSLALLAHILLIGAILRATESGTQAYRETRGRALEAASAVDLVRVSIGTHRLGLSVPPRRSIRLPPLEQPDFHPIKLKNEHSFQWGVEGKPITAAAAAARPGHTVHCEIHIHQDPQGQVQAVNLGPCTENSAWQRALLHAIVRGARMTAPRQNGLRAPEVTLTVDTNRISPVLVARILSNRESR